MSPRSGAPTRLTRERVALEEKRRATWLFAAAALGLAALIWSALGVEHRVAPRADVWFRRYVPVIRVVRSPLMVEMQIDAAFLAKPREEQRATLEQVVGALLEEDGEVLVVSFGTASGEFARWEDGRIRFVD
ncbi:hypothetical protein L6R50_27335 [Myxococcota bacterium]|nr:hypothetical protein [Myxococcota bacterium]